MAGFGNVGSSSFGQNYQLGGTSSFGSTSGLQQMPPPPPPTSSSGEYGSSYENGSGDGCQFSPEAMRQLGQSGESGESGQTQEGQGPPPQVQQLFQQLQQDQQNGNTQGAAQIKQELQQLGPPPGGGSQQQSTGTFN